jgi:hypothetical protein
MTGHFRRCINDLAMKEIYLDGRRYTWTNGWNPPTLVLLDRVLCTTDWEELAGECSLRCLASVVSGRSPMFLDCSPTPVIHRGFHFEDFWIRMPGFLETVASAWQSIHQADPLPAPAPKDAGHGMKTDKLERAHRGQRAAQTCPLARAFAEF